MARPSTIHERRYTASRTRPPDYPASLPFVADRDVEVVEGPFAPESIGARWLVSDPDALFAVIVSGSIAEGWRVRTRTRALPALARPDCVLERNNVIRRIGILRIDILAIVSISDDAVPDSDRHRLDEP